ncbi:hypothetical protein N9O88_00150 [bacterium]|nr:hypothetical protein [bacterium]
MEYSNAISLTDNNINFFKSINQEKLIALKNELIKDEDLSKDDNNKCIYLALHPIFKTEVIDNKLEYIVEQWEILARGHNTNYFPFSWFSNLSKEDRIKFTNQNAYLSKYLKNHDIIAKFNLQISDFEDIEKEDTYFEIAEFGESANKKKSIIDDDNNIKLAGCLFPLCLIPDSAFYSINSIFDNISDATLDDCYTLKNNFMELSIEEHFEPYRCYNVIESLIKYLQSKNNLNSISAIKIDFSVANFVYNTNPKDKNYIVSVMHREKLNSHVEKIFKLSKNIKFIIECTIPIHKLNNNYILDKMILEGTNQVLQQGGELENYAFRINSFEDNEFYQSGIFEF